MKQAFRLSSAAVVALVFVLGAIIAVRAQISSPTPDSFVLQITSTAPTPSPTATGSPTPTPSPSPTPSFVQPIDSYAWDMSRNGRFVVIESSGDIATDRTSKNNADGNREIFLFDYAQRRIFQITNTRSALKDASLPPTQLSNIDVEVSNNRPSLSADGRWIVFQSNAYVSDTNDTRHPGSFDGNSFKTELKADGNQEIFLYRIPSVAEADLTSGAETATVDLSAGNFFRITRSPASRVPQPGTATTAPDIIDDNRFPIVNADGTVVVFISTRSLRAENVAANAESNADGNAEIFAFRRNDVLNAGDTTAGRIYRVTDSANPANSAIELVFNTNPSVSDDGSVITFASTADYASAGTAEATANRGNAEVYTVGFNGSAIVANSLKRITTTPPDPAGGTVNFLSPGRRISPNGKFIAFESRADIAQNGTAAATLKDNYGTFLYNVDSGTFTLVGPRPTSGTDVLRFPTFTGDSQTLIFASLLNFRADGSAPTSSTDGLNPSRRTQIFSTPVSAPTTFRRLTDAPTTVGGAPSEVRAFPGQTAERIAFNYARAEFGGGNTDASVEAYYLLVPPAANESPAPSPSPTAQPFEFFTGASLRPVVTASPTPPAVSGLAPGMLGVVRASSIALAPSAKEVDKTSATDDRQPQLPTELNGVSVAINNALAGLYFVSPGQINFVVPVGLAASTTAYKFVVYNRNTNTLIRGTLLINSAQPDIFTSSNGPGGRAAALNATNKCADPTPEPFDTRTTRPKVLSNGTCSTTETETVQTELLLILTGIRNVNPRATGTPVSVQIKGAKDVTLTGDAIISIRPSRTAGFDELLVRLPEDLKGSGDSTVVVSVTIGGSTFTSRPADTAPRITIR